MFKNFKKPNLSFWQIWNMNVGFFGIQFSFGLQQTAINPIFSFLGASHDELPLLNLAGPVTGLLIQPIIGQSLIKPGYLNGAEGESHFS